MSCQEKREIIRGNETDISGIKPVTGKQWRKWQQTSIFVNIIFVFIYGMFTGWNPGLKINHTYRWKYMVTHILAYIFSQRKLVHSEIQMKGQNLLSLARLPLSSWARGAEHYLIHNPFICFPSSGMWTRNGGSASEGSWRAWEWFVE